MGYILGAAASRMFDASMDCRRDVVLEHKHERRDAVLERDTASAKRMFDGCGEDSRRV